jgi:Spy/CpxP family protein refolding chaperone
MNKKLMGVLMVLSLPLTSYSVQAKPGESDTDQRIERMTEALGLNADQKGKVEAIFNDQKAKLQALHQEERTRLQGVLTTEQMTKLDEMHQQRRHNQSGN